MGESLANLWLDCWIICRFCFTLCECDWFSIFGHCKIKHMNAAWSECTGEHEQENRHHKEMRLHVCLNWDHDIFTIIVQPCCPQKKPSAAWDEQMYPGSSSAWIPQTRVQCILWRESVTGLSNFSTSSILSSIHKKLPASLQMFCYFYFLCSRFSISVSETSNSAILCSLQKRLLGRHNQACLHFLKIFLGLLVHM